MPEYRSVSGSAAEDLFIDLFADTFGAEKAEYLYIVRQVYPQDTANGFIDLIITGF